MQKGPSSEPALEWKAIFSQLNAWGFSRASIELRLTLERMGSGLESSDARAKAKAEEDIQSFMTGLFSRDLHPEETDLTADVLRGITGAVATQVRMSRLVACTSTEFSVVPQSWSQTPSRATANRYQSTIHLGFHQAFQRRLRRTPSTSCVRIDRQLAGRRMGAGMDATVV